MNDICEYLITKNLPRILESPGKILYAINRMAQIEGDDPQTLLHNISETKSPHYANHRPIGGDHFKNEVLTLQQKIILQNILNYVIGLIIKHIYCSLEQGKLSREQLIKLTHKINEYDNNLKVFLSQKLKDIKILPELPASLDEFDDGFDKDFFVITEEEIEQHHLKTFEQFIQDFLDKIQQETSDEIQQETSDEIQQEPSEVPSYFLLGIWEKICEFFFWILEILSQSFSSTQTCRL